MDQTREWGEENVTEQNNLQTFRYAGFWMRFWAFLIDQIVLFSLNGILVYPILRAQGWMENTLGVFTIVGITTALLGYLYFTVMTKVFSRTLGKQLFGLRVIDTSGRPLTWQTAIFREVIGRYIHHVFFPFQALYLVVAFSDKKNGIHDRIADTYVVHDE